MRVIAGTAKGRKLESPPGLIARPTLDRVKEAIFGSIQFELEGSTFLDLFGGSGAMGIEAASRGAARVIINDISPISISCIRKNIDATHLNDRIEITQMRYEECLDYLIDLDSIIDIAMIDPPYHSTFGMQSAERIAKSGLLSKNGCIIVEHDWKLRPVPVSGVLKIRKQKKFGSCGYTIFESDVES